MKFRLSLALMSACLVGQLSAGTLQVFTFDTGNNDFAGRIAAANLQLNTLRIQNGGTLVDKENFEGFTASNGTLYTSLNTGIGTFSTLSGNQIGTGSGNKSGPGFTILDHSCPN